MGANVSTESLDDALYDHDEANITVISYLLQEASQENYLYWQWWYWWFVLIVYWFWKANLVNICKGQKDCWDRIFLDIDDTCIHLCSKCLQLWGRHANSGCDITSYPFSKGKIGALNILMAQNFPELSDVLREEHVTDEDLLNHGQHFFTAMYGQPPITNMNYNQHNL